MHFERNVNRAAIFALTFLSAPKVTPIASASLPLIPLVCPTQSYDYQAQISLHQDIQKRIDRNNDNLLDAKYASTRIKNASISDAPSFERAAYVVSKMNHYVILRAGHVTQRDFEDRCAEYKQLYDHALTTQTERSLPANQVAAGVVFGVGSLIPQISTLSKFLGVGSNGALGTASLFAGYSPIEKEARSRQRYAESTSALDTNLLFAAELSKMSPELKSQYALILEGQGVIPKDTWGIGSVGFSKALGENTSFPQLPQATEAGLSASSKTSVEKLRRINTGAKVPSDDKANVDVTAQTEAQKPSLKDKVAQLELEMNASGTPEVKLQKTKSSIKLGLNSEMRIWRSIQRSLRTAGPLVRL